MRILKLPIPSMTIWRLLKYSFFCLVVVLLAAGAGFYCYVTAPMSADVLPVRFEVPKGAGAAAVSKQLVAKNILPEPYGFIGLALWSGKAKTIKAGFYEIPRGQSMWVLLKRLEAGDILYTQVTFIEGSRFNDALLRLQANPDLKPLLADEEELKKKLGVKDVEGSIFPDTYRAPVGGQALEVLQMARQKMIKVLGKAWENRDPDTPWQSADEALVAASIIEKETALPGERPLVASVIINRLKIGMPLAMDPTVIYGLGDAFDGNLKKQHLNADQPYNTYKRLGLPPGPICLPSKSAIEAALHPAKTNWLYFVVDGKGSHVFSQSYEAHQRRVREMLQRQKELK